MTEDSGLDAERRARMLEARHSEETKARRDARRPKNQPGYAAFRENVGELQNVTEGRLGRYGEGNLRAAIELKCLECCSGDRTAIRECKSGDVCSLHPHRPYKQSSGGVCPDGSQS